MERDKFFTAIYSIGYCMARKADLHQMFWILSNAFLPLTQQSSKVGSDFIFLYIFLSYDRLIHIFDL